MSAIAQPRPRDNIYTPPRIRRYPRGAPCGRPIDNHTVTPYIKKTGIGATVNGSGATARVAHTIPWFTFALPPAPGQAAKTKTLGDMVGAYKSLCAHGCLQWIKTKDPRRRLGTLWQRDYWEHIIRDESELNRIREYIRNNPAKWEADRFYGRESDQIRETGVVYGEEDWMI